MSTSCGRAVTWRRYRRLGAEGAWPHCPLRLDQALPIDPNVGPEDDEDEGGHGDHSQH
jgi:hypothetical protein